jgi:hypothetical protein
MVMAIQRFVAFAVFRAELVNSADGTTAGSR